MKDNPWQLLPDRPPFVLPQDKAGVEEFNRRAAEDCRLRIDDLLPEPFIGDPTAPVILLSNNPGVGKHWKRRQNPGFMTRVRDGLCLKESKYPFISLDPEYCEIGRWWWQKLKCLLEKFGHEVVARSVCNIVYFPYPSKRFRHSRCELPSQQYGFDLVRAAVERRAVIVLMRKGKLRLWQDKVSEITGYDNLIVLRNPQMPAISPRNCNPGDYEKVVRAIEEAEMNRRKVMSDGFAAVYPHIAAWVREEEGWIEVGQDEFSDSFVRAVYGGGVAWEGKPSYPSLDEALRALDAGIAAWLGENRS